MMPSKTWSALLVLLAVSVPGLAALDEHAEHWCGTNRSSLAIALGVSHVHERERERQREIDPGLEAKAWAAKGVEAIGDVAVLNDDGSLFREPNPVDVADFGIRFTAKGKKGYQVAPNASGVADVLGTRLELQDDDSVFYKFGKGFKPKFFGKPQTGFFVNTDGNITFGAGDNLSTERGLQRFLNGPGRIAAFFTDLDPTIGPEGSGIFVSESKTAIVVTWLDVPEFGAASRRNTFQVKIEKNGRLTFTYGELGTREAVVGIAPGDGGAFTLLDYQQELPRTVSGAIAEQFSLEDGLDDLAISRMFLGSFADQYDSIIVWLDFPYLLQGRAFAYEFSLKNDVKGIGQPIFDASREAGSKGRMSSFVQMGGLANYPTDPDQTFLGTNTAMDVLGQEVGHRWLAFLAVFSPGNPSLLGRSFAHWSFFFDSDASDMEGNKYRDNGNGTFTTIEATSRYSQLDQYVIGLRAPSEVDDMFFIVNGAGSPSDAPAVGLTITGERRDVTIQDIIAAEGPRVPSSATARKNFNMAFVLVTRNGEAPKPGSVEKLERFRARWVEYWSQATDGRSTVDTTLVPR